MTQGMGTRRLRIAESSERRADAAARHRAAWIGLLLISAALGGCEYLVGEPDTSAMLDLYNPVTRTHKLCGYDVHKSPPSLDDRIYQEDCIANYKAQGYYLVGDIR